MALSSSTTKEGEEEKEQGVESGREINVLDEFALLYFFGSPSPQEQLST